MFPGGFGGIPDRLFPQTVPPTIPPDRPPFRKLIPIVYLEGTNKYPKPGSAPGTATRDHGGRAGPRAGRPPAGPGGGAGPPPRVSLSGCWAGAVARPAVS